MTQLPRLPRARSTDSLPWQAGKMPGDGEGPPPGDVPEYAWSNPPGPPEWGSRDVRVKRRGASVGTAARDPAVKAGRPLLRYLLLRSGFYAHGETLAPLTGHKCPAPNGAKRPRTDAVTAISRFQRFSGPSPAQSSVVTWSNVVT